MRNPLFLLNYVVYLYQGVRDLEEIIQIPTEKLCQTPTNRESNLKVKICCHLQIQLKKTEYFNRFYAGR